MNELGPDARALLAAARDAHDPDSATRARMRSELLRRVGAGAVVATTVATASKSAAAPVSAMITKLLVVAAVATGGAVLAHRATSSEVKPQPVVPIATTNAPAVVVVSSTPPALAPIEEPPPAPVVVKEPVVAAKPKPKPESTLAAELQSLRDAHVALREGRAGDALAIVDGMKGSSLAQERSATRVLALCALGRGDARTAADSFLAAHPSSPLAPRVRTACAIP